MEKYDICICCAIQDSDSARRLYESIKSYKLPPKTTLPDATLGYSNILLDSSESPFTEDAAAQLDNCRCLVLICSPYTKNCRPIIDRLAYFKKTRKEEAILLCAACVFLWFGLRAKREGDIAVKQT